MTRLYEKPLILAFALFLSFPAALTASEGSKAGTNRLIHEKSPYLLQHAENPVDWYAWGEEAMEKARREEKPIFLSIGYSTCHWCHVMEKESFSDTETAAFMNEHFVSIKVDREERPDIDQIYMSAVQAMTGSGGWPLNVFLTPDLEPFFGGTYFPPEDQEGLPGFRNVLNTVVQRWAENRADLIRSSQTLTKSLQAKMALARGGGKLSGEAVLEKGYEQFKKAFDSRYGGFGPAPKFPRTHVHSFLLRYWKRTGEERALRMVKESLTKMARGGIYDHLGGGFHRYSTDDKWRVPHFEKMLYDQAIISKTYLEAYQATGDEYFAKIAREVFEYVLRDLSHSDGAFFSAEDADSAPDEKEPDNKSEGAFYVWTHKEIEKRLRKEGTEAFTHYFGIAPDGNVAFDPHNEFHGKNILYTAKTLQITAREFDLDPKDLESSLERFKLFLFRFRQDRPRPHLDDKVLTDWNGLMISSLAFGSRVLNEPRYREAAQKAADFILQNMRGKEGGLMHRFRDGSVGIDGFLDDYAFFIHGLIDLYEATFEPKYLREALSLAEHMVDLFTDPKSGGFYFTAKHSEELIARNKELYDGAIPSGNSVAALALLRLSRLTMNRELATSATNSLKAFSGEIEHYPAAYPQMLIALDFKLGPSREIVLAGNESSEAISAMIREIYASFLPKKVVLLNDVESDKGKAIQTLIPFAAKQVPISGKPTAYVCKNYKCDLPTTEIAQLKKILQAG